MRLSTKRRPGSGVSYDVARGKGEGNRDRAGHAPSYLADRLAMPR